MRVHPGPAGRSVPAGGGESGTRCVRVLVVGPVTLDSEHRQEALAGCAVNVVDRLDGLDQVRVGGATPHVTLLDACTEDQPIDEAVASAAQRLPGTRVVVFAERVTTVLLLAGVVSGARGFVARSSGAAVLRQALRTVLAGALFVDPAAAHVVVQAALDRGVACGGQRLTLPQLRVLEGLAAGLKNAEIAARLGVSAETVKDHVGSLLRKTGCRNRTELALLATREGWT